MTEKSTLTALESDDMWHGDPKNMREEDLAFFGLKETGLVSSETKCLLIVTDPSSYGSAYFGREGDFGDPDEPGISELEHAHRKHFRMSLIDRAEQKTKRLMKENPKIKRAAIVDSDTGEALRVYGDTKVA